MKFGKKAGDDADKAPPKKALYTEKLDAAKLAKLHDILSRKLWVPFAVEHSLFAYKDDGVTVVGYNSGKLVISGKKTEDFIMNILEPQITGVAKFGYDEVHHPEWYTDHAGLDESGKGDLFGPIVSATVIATEDMVRGWIESGVKDSKAIGSDAAILRLEKQIRGTPGVVIKTVCGGMRRYNELYVKFGSNLNKLLAWMHAAGLDEALKVRESTGEPLPTWGLLDQFSTAPLVQRELKKRERDFDLQMRTKAESDPVVAAASIIARARFVRELNALSVKCGMTLPKGSGGNAKEVAKKLIEKYGDDALADYAKLHFRTAFEARGMPVPAKKDPGMFRRPKNNG
jgi:ribonuclease HIII